MQFWEIGPTNCRSEREPVADNREWNIEATKKKEATNAKAALPEQNLFKGRDTHLSLFPLQKVANDVRFN